VCDVFDALLSRRSYKEAWLAADALAEVRRCSGTQFDPSIVERFVEVVPELLAELADAEAPSVPSFAQSAQPRLA